MKANYGDWLQANFQAGTRTTQLSQARRLEDAFGDLDKHFERDRFASILAELSYSAADKAAGKVNPSRIQIEKRGRAEVDAYAYTIHFNWRALSLASRQACARNSDSLKATWGSSLSAMRVAKRPGEFSRLKYVTEYPDPGRVTTIWSSTTSTSKSPLWVIEFQV
jgi:hypothetical protein